jgi:hypothetical protein
MNAAILIFSEDVVLLFSGEPHNYCQDILELTIVI